MHTWGEKAIAIARESNDEEALSHALNNVGSVQMNLAIIKRTRYRNVTGKPGNCFKKFFS